MAAGFGVVAVQVAEVAVDECGVSALAAEFGGGDGRGAALA